MSILLFTATGCARCKIVKRFMVGHGIAFSERDMKADGKDDFQKFYAANRKSISRGADGVEFPILADGEVIRQGIGPAIAHLQSGAKLDGFVDLGRLHREWVDGLHVSGGNPDHGDEFVALLRHLRSAGMKLHIDTDGRNAALLHRIVAEKLADVVVMNFLGPPRLYGQLLGAAVETVEIARSIALVSGCPDHRFETTIAPVLRRDGTPPEITYLSPDEIAETARMLAEQTNTVKAPYVLKLFRPADSADAGARNMPLLTATDLLAYRAAARKHQMATEIEKV